MLQQTFLDEMFLGVTVYEDVFKVVALHVQDRDIGKAGKIHKKVLAVVKKLYKDNSDTLPTLGQIQQIAFSTGGKSMTMDKIIGATKTKSTVILNQLSEYILSVRTEQAIHDFAEDFNKSKEHRKPVSDLRLNLDGILDLNIVGDEYESTNPFDNYYDLLKELSNTEKDYSKVSFGIPILDKLCDGGMSVGDTALFIMRSGVGKSTILKFISFMATRFGHGVLHFQLEGSSSEAQMKYNQLWTGLGYRDITSGNNVRLNKPRKMWSFEKGRYEITERNELLKITQAKMNYMRSRFNKFNLEIVSFEEFGTPDMSIVENKVIEYIERNGYPPGLISIDSLDLMHPGDGLKYGYDTQSIKMRIQNSAKIMKNISTKYGSRVLTVTQTGNVRFEDWNNEDFVIDRSYALGDKNVANPFSFVFTGNRTIIEKRNDRIRIFIDKLRDYDGEGNIYELITDYDHGKAININALDNEKLNKKKEEASADGEKTDKK